LKRTVTEVIRRGFDLTIGNWPLLVIRIAEHVLFVMLTIGALVATVIPILLAAGFGNLNLHAPPDETAQSILLAVLEHWPLLLFILGVALVLCIILLAAHSFVQAGTVEVYVSAERAGTEFSMDRWLAGATRGWRRLFGVYNLAWLYAGLAIVAPLTVIAIIITLLGVSTMTLVVAVVLLVIWAFFALFVGLATMIWTTKATVVAIAGNLPARDALTAARQAIRSDRGTHLAVSFVMFAIMLGGTALVGAFSTSLSLGEAFGFSSAAHLAVSILDAIVTSAVDCWFLASFTAISEP
jgi:hypothetical protein